MENLVVLEYEKLYIMVVFIAALKETLTNF